MLNVIKSKWYWAGAMMMVPLMALAQSGQSKGGLTQVVKNTGSFFSSGLTLLLFLLMGAGVIVVGLGLWNIMNKDKNPQANQGGPMKLIIGLCLIAVPALIGLATGEFFGETSNVEDVIADPFKKD